MESYLVPAGFGEAEFTEKRSRFIGRVWRTDSEEEALLRLKETRERHRDATHNVYAYIIRENNLTRYSDDGEPSGTSGMPTLNVFIGEKIQNVTCVVTRYFGGTLLGTGGLARAYSKAAKLALEAAGVEQRSLWREYLISCDYGFYERAKRLLDEHFAVIKSSDFGADIAMEVLIRADRAPDFEAALTESSAGRALCETVGEEFVGVRV